MEWLHDWIVVSKRIVQKYTVEVLNVDRNALRKKCRFSVSPDTDEMRRPSAFRNSMAEVLTARIIIIVVVIIIIIIIVVIIIKDKISLPSAKLQEQVTH